MSKTVSLSKDTPSVQYLCSKDKRLARVIDMVGPINYIPHTEEPFSFLVHEIIEQMLSVKSGKIIYDRLAKLCNGDISPEQIRKLSDEQIRSIGTSNSKVNYIRNVTNTILNGDLDLSKLKELADTEITNELTKIRGIGTWTAKMYLIFVLNRPNVLPFEDGAFLQTYRWMYKTNICDKISVQKRCQKWHPYSSIAARFCYRALDMGLTKNEFHLYK